MTASYKWHPISDLPQDLLGWADSEIRSLWQVWFDQKRKFHPGALQQFDQRLRREWAIEAGVVEHVYTLNRGVTQILIEHGIDASLIPSDATNKNPDVVALIIRDHAEAVDGIFDFVKGDRKLSTGYIKELHALITRHQTTTTARDQFGTTIEVPLLRGAYKQQPNNPLRPDGGMHEYCPPEHVASEMDRLIELYQAHEERNVPPELEAGWFHHAFTQIHPFQDGNGRLARSLASLIFIRVGWFPLIITRDDVAPYIAALEQADTRSLLPLVKLFADNQKRTFVKAISLSKDIQQQQDLDQVISAARQALEERSGAREEFSKAEETARALFKEAAEYMNSEVAERLRREIGGVNPNFTCFVTANEGLENHDYRFQAVQAARRNGYAANFSAYYAWVRLLLKSDSETSILLSFHGVGLEYSGVLAAAMCYFRYAETEAGQQEVVHLETTAGLFQINYQETLESTRQRFKEWLNDAVVNALDTWRSGL